MQQQCSAENTTIALYVCERVHVQQLINVAGCTATATHISAILSSNRNEMHWMWRGRRRLDESVHCALNETLYIAQCKLHIFFQSSSSESWRQCRYFSMSIEYCSICVLWVSLTSNKGSFKINFKWKHRFVCKTLYNINTIFIWASPTTDRRRWRWEKKNKTKSHRINIGLFGIYLWFVRVSRQSALIAFEKVL